MSDTLLAPYFDIRVLLDILDNELTSVFELLAIQPEEYQVVEAYLVRDLQNVRFNLLNDPLAVSDTWRSIRSIPTLTDVVLDLTTLVHFHADALKRNGWSDLIGIVSSSISCFNRGPAISTNSVLKEADEIERFVSEADAADMVTANHWLVALFLLRQTATVRRFVSQIASGALRRQRQEAITEANA